MADKNLFTEKIQKSYSSAEPHIFLGAGVLQNEIISEAQINLPLRMMNRHGLVAGATGTGKTRTLQLIAEQLSDAGVPVFLLDVKGDLSGLNKAGSTNPKLEERAKQLGTTFSPSGFPVELYSLSGKLGAPMRATVLEFGATLLSKVFELNDTQTGTLAVVFKYADDNKLPLVDLNDLKKTLTYLTEGAGKDEIKNSYGRISTATASTILRKIAALETQGAGQIFGEPSFDINDLFDRVDGKGVISLLNISDVQQQPALYSTFLLSLLVEIFQNMPEAGDLDKPKLVFFFDEAHLLFKDAPKAFLEQIEQVVRLIRSKGIGVFFCTQSPMDIPETVLAQLGNRVQHALRAFTPNDADNLRKTVKTYPRSEFYAIDEALTSLGTGQALITVLNEKGSPTEVAVTHLIPPRSLMGPLPEAEYKQLYQTSDIFKKYEKTIDPISAYEILTERLNNQQEENTKTATQKTSAAPRAKQEKSMVETVLKNPVAREIGKQLVRGVFGMLFGTTSRSTRKRR